MYLVSPSVRLALGGNETWHTTGQNACLALPLHHQRNSGEHSSQLHRTDDPDTFKHCQRQMKGRPIPRTPLTLGTSDRRHADP